MEKEMTTHSGILAWKIPWTEDSGKLQSMGSQRVGHDLETEHACTHKVIRSSNIPVVVMKVAQSCLTLCGSMDSPWNSPGQNTGVGKPFPSPGDLPNPGI